MIYIKKQFIARLLSLFIFLALCIPVFSYAQSGPQFMVSWKSKSFAPHWYMGKNFPSNGSTVDVRFNLVDKGKIINLSRSKIRWYVNDALVANESRGLGLQSLSITMPQYGTRDVEVRITLPDYPGGQIDKIIIIPSISPEVVIDRVDERTLRAYPFFFGVNKLSDLSFIWKAFQKTAEASKEEPWRLQIQVDSGAPIGLEIPVSVLVRNIVKEIEFATKDIMVKL